MKLLHRFSTGIACGTALLLVVTGCSQSNTADETTSGSGEESQAELLPPGEGTTEYPLELETAWGTTVLEERPTRVAAVQQTAQDAEILAALGVTPVLMSDAVDKAAVWTRDALDALPAPAESTYPSDSSTPPFETVAASEPDLVIATGTDLSVGFDDLAAIAPVVAAPTADDVEASWEDNLRRIAEALDLSAAGEQVIEDYRTHFADVAAAHPDLQGLTASYSVFYGGSTGLTYFTPTGSDAEQVFLDLGFAPNPNAEDFADTPTVSPELYSKLDSDVIIISDNNSAEFEQMTDNAVFAQLPAVRDNHLAVLNLLDPSCPNGYVFHDTCNPGNLAWALARLGPLSGTWAAERLVDVVNTTLQ